MTPCRISFHSQRGYSMTRGSPRNCGQIGAHLGRRRRFRCAEVHQQYASLGAAGRGRNRQGRYSCCSWASWRRIAASTAESATGVRADPRVCRDAARLPRLFHHSERSHVQSPPASLVVVRVGPAVAGHGRPCRGSAAGARGELRARAGRDHAGAGQGDSAGSAARRQGDRGDSGHGQGRLHLRRPPRRGPDLGEDRATAPGPTPASSP